MEATERSSAHQTDDSDEHEAQGSHAQRDRTQQSAALAPISQS
jgi:hypothetical protein